MRKKDEQKTIAGAICVRIYFPHIDMVVFVRHLLSWFRIIQNLVFQKLFV